jgi:hypothetical protein
VLVNFDMERATAAATVLRDFAASGHQMLVFTCHEHIAQLFRDLKAAVRELPENSVREPAALIFDETVKEPAKEKPKKPVRPAAVAPRAGRKPRPVEAEPVAEAEPEVLEPVPAVAVSEPLWDEPIPRAEEPLELLGNVWEEE